jgi:Ser/Thr protein kinase RdoA (MazF antagonist)
MRISVTEDQVQGVVEGRYGLRVVQPLINLPEGVHSRAWLAHTDDGEWVVKVSDPRSDSPGTLSAQCGLYAFLNSRGLHAPVVKVDRAGHNVSTVTVAAVTYPITLMRHHQLRRLEPESVSADDLRQVAAEVARLHSTMDEFPRKHEIILDREKSRAEWGQQAEGCYEKLIESPTAECFTTAEKSWLRAIDTELLAHLETNFPDPAALTQAVLHGDLSFEHVRLLLNRQVYFFDFGDMCWGPAAHELAWFLRGFYNGPISFERWSNLRRWLLEGYRSRHLFTEADAAAIDVFLLNRAVGLANYIIELNANEVSPDAADAIRNTYRLAEAVLQRHHLPADRTT